MNALQQIQYFNAKTQEIEEAYLYVLYHEGSRSVLQLDRGNNSRISCYNNGKLDDYAIMPALIVMKDGEKIYESHYFNGLKHNKNGPAVRYYGVGGIIRREEHYEYGKLIEAIDHSLI